MIKTSDQQRGVTILEILLVIVIGASVLMLSINQYRLLKTDFDVRQLQSNVNALMQSMASFYYVNCRGLINPSNTTYVPGKLNPYNNSNSTYLVDIQTQLVTGGFLRTNISTILPYSPLVDPGLGNPPNGYVVQFNRASVPRQICGAGTNVKNGPNDPNCTTKWTTGTSVIWLIQVAVALNPVIPPAQYDLYKNLTGADCLSSVAGSGVAPCTQNSTGSYLVWQRLPSMATIQNQTHEALSFASPLSGLFVRFFDQYPNMQVINGSIPPTGATHYYMCGS